MQLLPPDPRRIRTFAPLSGPIVASGGLCETVKAPLRALEVGMVGWEFPIFFMIPIWFLCKPVTIQCVSFCEELCGECEGLQHRRMFIPIVLCTYVVILYSTVLWRSMAGKPRSWFFGRKQARLGFLYHCVWWHDKTWGDLTYVLSTCFDTAIGDHRSSVCEAIYSDHIILRCQECWLILRGFHKMTLARSRSSIYYAYPYKGFRMHT